MQNSIFHVFGLASVFVVLATWGCGANLAHVDERTSQRVTQTEIRQIATGAPVWLQKTVKVQEFGWDGQTSSSMVGYLYCENITGRGPSCVPVKLEDLPPEMMFHEVLVETVSNVNSSGTQAGSQVVDPYASQAVEGSSEPAPATTAPVVRQTNEKEIMNMDVSWNDTSLKSILSLYLQQKIRVVTKKGNTFDGTLSAIHTSATDENPRLVLIDDSGRRFGVKLELISKVVQ